MHQSSILSLAEVFVKSLIGKQLPSNKVFNNIQHAEQVVRANVELCTVIVVSETEKELLTLAAWFHDTGHISAYQDHEAISKEITERFLKKNRSR